MRRIAREPRLTHPMRARISAALVALVAACVTASAAPAVAKGCARPPRGLSPPGPKSVRFTMLIRVNKVGNAQTYASRDRASGGLADRIRPQDVFVVNTRFAGSSPADWSRIVTVLARAFPCNRIVALNGLGADPSIPGYAYALRGDRRIWGVLTDWERLDWNEARSSNSYLAPWSGRLGRVRKRIRRWVGLVTLWGGIQRAGVAPELRPKWDYGELARSASGPNRRIAPGRRGLQSVQTQEACADGGGRAMKAAIGSLLHEYKLANFRRLRAGHGRLRRFRYRRRKWRVHPSNLSVQISFTGVAQPYAGLPLLRTSPARAAKCTQAALKRGAGAVLYWASPDSMRALLATPRVCALRPSSAC